MTFPSYTTFARNTMEAFNFLVEKHGCRADAESAYEAVVFTNNVFRITVSRDPRLCEIDVDFCRRDTGQEYNLSVILHVLAPNEVLNAKCSGADTTKMKRCLDRLSQICQRHLPSVFAVEEPILAKVDSLSKERNRQFTLQAQYGRILDNANLAWETKDWEKALELYKKAEPGLSTIHQRRLKFLLKRIQRDGTFVGKHSN